MSAPKWARPPPSNFALTEIKNGIQVAQHVLDKATTTLGRAGDIELAHSSCSRLHASISFDVVLNSNDSNDVAFVTVWLKDHGSTHGTTVNKKPLPKQACGKTAGNDNVKGSRGVMIFPGDVLQFGASTRLYIIEGPEVYSRANYKARMASAASTKTTLPQPSSATESVSSLLEQIPDSAQQVPEYLRDEYDNVVQLKQQWQAYTAKQQSMANDQLGRDLQTEITEKVASFLKDLHPATGGYSFRSKREADDYYDDSVDDRTNEIDNANDDNVETEASLTAKYKSLMLQIDKLQQHDLPHTELQLIEVQNRIARLKEAGDEEEVYFVQNDLNLVKEKVDKIKQSIEDFEEQQKEVRKLLLVANPKVKFDSNGAIVDTAKRHVQKTLTQAPVNEDNNTVAVKNEDTRESKPIQSSLDSNRTDDFVVPASKRSRVEASPDNVVIPESNKSTVTQSENIMAPPPVTNSAPKTTSVSISSTIMSSMPPPPAAIVSHSDVIPTNKLLFKADDEDGHDQVDTTTNAATTNTSDEVWKPPSDQDGSGRTKLNAKFAGRY